MKIVHLGKQSGKVFSLNKMMCCEVFFLNCKWGVNQSGFIMAVMSPAS